MMVAQSKNLLSEIDAFLTETGMSPSYFGKRAANNGRLVERLRSGRRIWPDAETRVREFMSAERKRRLLQGSEVAA